MATEDEIRAHLDHKRWSEAFELVLRTYQNKVFHLALSMLAHREQAEDTAQEIFLRIWRALPGYRSQSSVSTWIYSIARNACLTELKNAGARRAVSLQQPGVLAAAEQARRGNTVEGIDVESLVAQLPEKQRHVVALFYMEEKSYEEVARMLDMPVGTVKTHLHRARKELALRWRKESSNAVR